MTETAETLNENELLVQGSRELIKNYEPTIGQFSIHSSFPLFVPEAFEKIQKFAKEKKLKISPAEAPKEALIITIEKEKIKGSDFLLWKSKLDQYRSEIMNIQRESTSEKTISAELEKNTFIEEISGILASANQDIQIDPNEAFLVVMEIVGHLSQRIENDLIVFDEKEAKLIANAITEKKPELAKKNLQEALILMIQKIFLFLISVGEASTKTCFISANTDITSMACLSDKTVLFLDEQCTVNRLPVVKNPKNVPSGGGIKNQTILYSPTHNLFFSPNCGKEARQRLLDLKNSLILGNVIIGIDTEYGELIFEFINRFYQAMAVTLSTSNLQEIEKMKLEDFQKLKDSLLKLLKAKYQTINILTNSIEQKAIAMNVHYKRNIYNSLSNQFLGNMPKNMMEVSGLKKVEDYAPLVERAKRTRELARDFLENLHEKLNVIEKSIKDNNKPLLQKAYSELKDWVKTIKPDVVIKIGK